MRESRPGLGGWGGCILDGSELVNCLDGEVGGEVLYLSLVTMYMWNFYIKTVDI